MENLDFVFKSSAEQNVQNEVKRKNVGVEFAPLINVTNKVYKTKLQNVREIKEFASESLNVVHSCKSTWRLTMFIPRLTLNFFKNSDGICMVMTKELNEEIVSNLMYEHLKERPYYMEVINITLILNVKQVLDIDELFKVGKSLTKHEIHCFVDKNRYPAIIIRPCSKRKIVMEIFRTGMINLTGLTKNEEIEEMKTFIGILLGY